MNKLVFLVITLLVVGGVVFAGVSMSGAAGGGGGAAVERVAAMPQLTSLDVSMHNFCAAGVLFRSSCLTSLVANNAFLDDDDIYTIGGLAGLTDLDLSCNYISTAAALALTTDGQRLTQGYGIADVMALPNRRVLTADGLAAFSNLRPGGAYRAFAAPFNSALGELGQPLGAAELVHRAGRLLGHGRLGLHRTAFLDGLDALRR